MFISDSMPGPHDESFSGSAETKEYISWLPNILIKVADLFPSTKQRHTSPALSNGDEMKCNTECAFYSSFSKRYREENKRACSLNYTI